MLELFFKGGFLMYPIALCSFCGLSIIINRYLLYRFLIKSLEKPLEEILQQPPPLFSPILAHLKEGVTEAEVALVGTKQVRQIESGLSWLGLIATIAPLLGLTGTVTGMITAFTVISQSATVNPAQLAGGIWEALTTTAFGLLVAITIHIGQHYLEIMADKIVFLMKEITINLQQRGVHGI